MSDNISIKKLAELARIDLSDDHTGMLSHNISEILSYVTSVKEVADQPNESPTAGPVHNVLREDTDPHEPGAFRDALLREAPAVDDDGFIIVPPIL